MQHKWHKEIKAWADGAEIEKWMLNDTWQIELRPDWWDYERYRIKPPAKCITKECTNHVGEGKFVGDLCAPCWDYITNGKGVHSQAYRNAQPKEPQYLYVYLDYGGITLLTNKLQVPAENVNYIGKIKLENDDE